MAEFDFNIKTKKDLIEAVEKFGVVPLFKNSLKGFSVEEHVSPEVWFSENEGVWEWKGPVIRETGCAYGKFFEKKACFISPEWFLHFANYRRDGYDFDARYDSGLAYFGDKRLYDLINGNAPILSKALKRIGNYGKDGVKGFDTMINRLEAQGYVIISDFVYQRDKYGMEYGWGVAEYSTPEIFMGHAFTDSVYLCEPEQSRQLLTEHLINLLPHESEEKIKRFIK